VFRTVEWWRRGYVYVCCEGKERWWGGIMEEHSTGLASDWASAARQTLAHCPIGGTAGPEQRGAWETGEDRVRWVRPRQQGHVVRVISVSGWRVMANSRMAARHKQLDRDISSFARLLYSSIQTPTAP
jgi:hypothetical protein